MSQDTTAAPAGRFRVNLKGLILGVACLAAIAWAGRAVWENVEINKLQKTLRSGEPDDRMYAARVLGTTEDDDVDAAVPALCRALADDPDAGVRAIAANGLGMTGLVVWKRSPAGPAGPEAVRALTAALKDGDASVRGEAAAALGLLARSAPIAPPPSLCDLLLSDASVDVRVTSATALGMFRKDPEVALPALFDGLGRDKTRVRLACFNALSSDKLTPNGSSVPLLLKALKDGPDVRVRSRAAALLGRVEPPDAQAVAPLIAALNEPVGKEPPPLVDPPPPGAVPLAGAVVAGGGGGGGSAPESWDVAVHAANALGRVAAKVGSEADAGTALAALMKSEVNWRANAAASGLAAMGPKALKVAPALIGAVKDSVENGKPDGDGVNSSAARALGEVAPGSASAPEAVDVLTRALDSPHDGLRNAAVAALPKFGKAAEPAVPKLQSLVDRPNGSRAEAAIGRQARRAIAQIQAGDGGDQAAPVPGGT